MKSDSFQPSTAAPLGQVPLPPHLELRRQSQRILELIGRGLDSGNPALIHDAGQLLEAFTAFGSQQRLYAQMATELTGINDKISYDRSLESIQKGLISSESLCALFEYVTPSLNDIIKFIDRAPDVVPMAFEAFIRTGLIEDYFVDDLIQDIRALPDSSALAVLMQYKLDRYRRGSEETFNVPELISDYFAEAVIPASLEDAGAIGEFLGRELPALAACAEQEEALASGYSEHLFSLETFEMLAASGRAAEVARMAVFCLDADMDEVRSRSRLAKLVPAQTVAERTFDIIGTLRRISTAHLNFFLESPLISTAQFCTILGVGDSRLNATGIMTALGGALSVYAQMEQVNRGQLLEKGTLAIERFVELIGSYSQGIPKELIPGLKSVYRHYNQLDAAGKSMLDEQTLRAISHCMLAMDNKPQQKEKLQQEIVALEDLPKAVWQSVEWMQTQTLERDLGL